MLSARDKLILDRLLEGKGYKHIGRELGVAASTVGSAVRLICAKLDVPGRIVAAAKWSELKRLK